MGREYSPEKISLFISPILSSLLSSSTAPLKYLFALSFLSALLILSPWLLSILFLYSLFHISWRGSSSVWLVRQTRSVARSILSQHNSIFSLTLIKVHLASKICWARCGESGAGERTEEAGRANRPECGKATDWYKDKSLFICSHEYIQLLVL